MVSELPKNFLGKVLRRKLRESPPSDQRQRPQDAVTTEFSRKTPKGETQVSGDSRFEGRG